MIRQQPLSTLFPYTTLFRSAEFTENIINGVERMPHDLSHLGFLAGQIGRLITISRSEERRVGKECRSRWSRYLKKKKNKWQNTHNNNYIRQLCTSHSGNNSY